MGNKYEGFKMEQLEEVLEALSNDKRKFTGWTDKQGAIEFEIALRKTINPDIDENILRAMLIEDTPEGPYEITENGLKYHGKQ